MLVDEWSTSVDSVKKGPPFAIMKAGNANRTKSKRRSDPYGREKFITYEMEGAVAHPQKRKTEVVKLKKALQLRSFALS